jgi:phage terminase small subunit
VDEKQRRFANLILEGKTQTEAYQGAGYESEGVNARVRASQVIRLPAVQRYLAEKRAELSRETGVTAQRIIEEYVKIAFSDIGSVVNWNELGLSLLPLEDLPPEVTAAIKEIAEKRDKEGFTTYKVKLHDKQRALKELGVYLGIFKESQSGEGDFDEWLKQLEEANEKYGSES